MIKHMTKLTGWTASLVALAATASADVKINDNLSLSGYAAAAGTITDTTPAASPKDTLFNSGLSNLDSALVAANGKYQDFTGKVSLYYVPNHTTNQADILDAYVAYTAGEFTITGGKFCTYLGYESFYAASMNQLTYGSTVATIPGYHTGAKVDYTTKTFGAGVAVVDSLNTGLINPGKNFVSGDGNFKHLGTEAYVTYTGIDKLTLWEGIGYDDHDDAIGYVNTFINDFWVSYALNAKTTVAAEYVYDDVATTNVNSWLLFAQYTFTDKISALARVSSIKIQGGDTGSYFTVSSSYKLTSNLTIRGEVSYADSIESGSVSLPGGGKGAFYGAQAVFTF